MKFLKNLSSYIPEIFFPALKIENWVFGHPGISCLFPLFLNILLKSVAMGQTFLVFR